MNLEFTHVLMATATKCAIVYIVVKYPTSQLSGLVAYFFKNFNRKMYASRWKMFIPFEASCMTEFM